MTPTFRSANGKILSAGLIFFCSLLQIVSSAQVNALESLKGKYAIGFSQMRQAISVKGYSSVTCMIDLWYPIDSPFSEQYSYKDYLLVHPDSTAERTLRQTRSAFQAFFGSTTDSAWNALLSQKALAYKNTQPPKKKLPLILGMLRPFSTTNTCEILATQGYMVAMINQVDDFAPDDSVNWNVQMNVEMTLYNGIIDQFAAKNMIDRKRVGLFGFSGSGFSQFLYAMHSARPKCIALLESGLYAEGLFDAVNRSGLYRPTNLRIPFLYFHNAYTDTKNQYREEFYKIASAKKVKVLYVDSAMHHWDYASEGFLSSVYLQNRQQAVAIRQTKNYQNVNGRLIDFFNEYLRNKHSNLRIKATAGSPVVEYPQ